MERTKSPRSGAFCYEQKSLAWRCKIDYHRERLIICIGSIPISVKYFRIILVVLVLFLGGGNFAVAVGPVGITITPLKYVFDDTAPGEHIVKEVTVINPNNFTLHVRPEFQDFKVTENNEIQWIPTNVENPYKMTDWIGIDQGAIALEPYGERKLSFTIDVPQDASPGGHYAAIFFSAILDTEGGNVGSIPRVGSLVIMNVRGDVEKSGELLSFNAPFFVRSGPVVFSFSFLNTGTTHYENSGQITLRNMLGQKTVISSEKKFVYPGIQRDIQAVWERKYPTGIYFAKASIADGEGNTYNKSRLLFALPLVIFLPVLGGVLILWVLWRVFKSRFKIVRNVRRKT